MKNTPPMGYRLWLYASCEAKSKLKRREQKYHKIYIKDASARAGLSVVRAVRGEGTAIHSRTEPGSRLMLRNCERQRKERIPGEIPQGVGRPVRRQGDSRAFRCGRSWQCGSPLML